MLLGDPNPDYAYDIYAFGILMYEIISLTPVYAGLTDRQVAQEVGEHVQPHVFTSFMPADEAVLYKRAQCKHRCTHAWAPFTMLSGGG